MELLAPKVSITYTVFCEEANGFLYEVASYGSYEAAKVARDGIIKAQVDCYVHTEPRIKYVHIVTKQTIEQFTSKDIRSTKVAIAEHAAQEVSA